MSWSDKELRAEVVRDWDARIRKHLNGPKQEKLKRWEENTYIDIFNDPLYHMSWEKEPPDVWDPNRGRVYFADEEDFFSDMFPEEEFQEKEYHPIQPLRLLTLSSGYWRENGENDLGHSFEEKEFPDVDGFMCKRFQDQRGEGFNDWGAATSEICIYPKALHKIKVYNDNETIIKF